MPCRIQGTTNETNCVKFVLQVLRGLGGGAKVDIQRLWRGEANIDISSEKILDAMWKNFFLAGDEIEHQNVALVVQDLIKLISRDNNNSNNNNRNNNRGGGGYGGGNNNNRGPSHILSSTGSGQLI